MSINLSGQWQCILDQDDVGFDEAWYERDLIGQSVMLPGSTNENQLGKPLDTSNLSNKEMVKSLRQNYYYEGMAWYQKVITIGENSIKLGHLFFERVMFQSNVWIDDVFLGTNESLSCPHTYDIPFELMAGKTYRLTVAIDNRDVAEIGQFASAYTEETQSIWNGIVGAMLLQSKGGVTIQQMKVIPHGKVLDTEGSIDLDMTIRKNFSDATQVVVVVELNDEKLEDEKLEDEKLEDKKLEDKKLEDKKLGDKKLGDKKLGENNRYQETFTLRDALNHINLTMPLTHKLELWDAFNPHLYHLDVRIMIDDLVADEQSLSVGFRDICVEGNRILVNGKTTFLRGTLECCIFPKTGYPPTDRASWDKLFSTLKDYGLNHLRFHSWCPPEAAYCSADEAGIYLQIEGPVWMDTWCGMTVGAREKHYKYLMEEALRIVNTYGHHPSFCFFSNGNELNGDFKLLHDIIVTLKEDTRFLYTLTTNWDRQVDEADDIFIAQTVDGIGVRGQYYKPELVASSTKTFDEAVIKRKMPIISHEIGQYSVYPQMSEIVKYDGNLKAVNFQWIRDDLIAKNMIDQAERYTYASGKLALELYKSEIEMALRTEGFGGFQLLDLHDFPGQSTATVGILDSFWESKKLIAPRQFREFCNNVVPLVICERRIYSASDNISFGAKIANYSNETITNSPITWKVIDSSCCCVVEGLYEMKVMPQGQLVSLERIILPRFETVKKARIYTIEIEMLDRQIKNSLEIYIVPDASEVLGEHELLEERSRYADEKIVVHKVFDQAMQDALADGKSVLYMPNPSDIATAKKGNYYPVMWSPVHFVSQDDCGAMISKKHPLFNDFETKDYAGFIWMNMMEHSFTVDLKMLPVAIEPIIEVVPNFFNNARRTPLFEANVGQGKVIFCGFDLLNKASGIEGAYLFEAIKSYMKRPLFNPKVSLTLEPFEQLHVCHQATKTMVSIGKAIWRGADNQLGQAWQIDLGEVRTIVGTKMIFEHEANYLYVIQTSTDGETWTVVANQTGQTDRHQERIDLFDANARFVRVVYNGSPDEVVVENVSFEVFG